MWSLFQADLKELVSTVKEDTNVLVEKFDESKDTQKVWAAQREAERRMKLEETFTMQLLQVETNSSSYNDSTMNQRTTADVVNEEDKDSQAIQNTSEHGTDDDDVDDNGDDDDDADDVTSANVQVPEEDEYVQEIKRVQVFLQDFDIEQRTEEISILLEQYPNTLQKRYEELVPDVISYKDFWERYFYRCDALRIREEWETEETKARQVRAKLVGKVSNLLGEAAKAVVTGMANALTEEDEVTEGEGTRKNSTQQRSIRPPFVLNTAVDEDNDEEEELGWDDEDDNVDEGPEGYMSNEVVSGITVGDEEEIIEFKDEVLEKTREDLKQALEERDQLHQTIELQKQELLDLRTSKTASIKAPTDATLIQEVESLRLEIIEKEADLLALKNVPLESNVEKSISQQLAEKDILMAEQQTYFDARRIDYEKTIETLEQEVEALKRTTTTNEAEIISTQKANSILSLEIEQLKVNLESAEAKSALLKTELEATKKMLMIAEQKSVNQSGDTITSGVNAEAPPSVTKLVDNDEDGWGDDWD